MQRSYAALIMCAVLLCAACKKSSNTPQKIDDVTYPSYSHMAAGNYWIYRLHDLDSNYNVIDSTNTTDSIYVEKDTVIAGQTYHKYWAPSIAGSSGTYSASFLRDSLDYIVNSAGFICFSSQDFTTIFYDRYYVDTAHIISPVDTPYHSQSQMADKDKTITVPAGTYVTSSWQTTYFMNQLFAQSTPVVRRVFTRYSTSVGMVSQIMPITAHLSSPDYIERRLVRCHVQ